MEVEKLADDDKQFRDNPFSLLGMREAVASVSLDKGSGQTQSYPHLVVDKEPQGDDGRTGLDRSYVSASIPQQFRAYKDFHQWVMDLKETVRTAERQDNRALLWSVIYRAEGVRDALEAMDE
jgi:hypothetical protein